MGSIIESKHDNDDTQDEGLSSYGQLWTVINCGLQPSEQGSAQDIVATFADELDETAAYGRADEDPMNCGG